MAEGIHIKGWGFKWIVKERLPEFNARIGVTSSDDLQNIMGEVLKKPDKSYNIGKCKDVSKKISGICVIVRTYNGSIQTIIGIPDAIPNAYQEVEFRALIPVLGEEEVIHEGVIFVKNENQGCSCFLPFFPRYYGKIKPMTKIKLALEIIPYDVKIEKKGIFSKVRNVGCYSIKGETRPYINEIVGKIIKKTGKTYLIEAGFRFYCEINKDINLIENQIICIKGPIFGYIK